MLSPRAAVLVCLLGSAEGYAAVRDDRVFASSRNQHGKNSTTSDHEGDMKVSLGVQADASVSELKEDMDGVQEVQTLKAADDEGLSSLGETDHKVAFAVDSFGSVTATDSMEVRRLHAKLDNLDDMYKTNLTRSNLESPKQPPPWWKLAAKRGLLCSELEGKNAVTKCGKCLNLKYAGHRGCGSITSEETTAAISSHTAELQNQLEKETNAGKKEALKIAIRRPPSGCGFWYEWGLFGDWHRCRAGAKGCYGADNSGGNTPHDREAYSC